MMAEVEHGIVKFFDHRRSKKYGFIRVLDTDGKETGEEIFFHFNDGELVDTVMMGKVSFHGSGVAEIDGQRITIGTPRKGYKIYFLRKSGKNGKPKACPWVSGKQQCLSEFPDGHRPTISEMLEQEKQVLAEHLTHFLEEEELSSMEEDCLLEEDTPEDDISTVHHRISQWAGGNPELAREAMQMYPGDFI